MKYIDFPIELSKVKSFVFDKDAVLNNVKFVLLTMLGSVVYKPNYGLGLHSLLYSSFSNEDIKDMIVDALSKLSFKVSNLKVEVLEKGRAKIVNLYFRVDEFDSDFILNL